jgi:hypothetical protein
MIDGSVEVYTDVMEPWLCSLGSKVTLLALVQLNFIPDDGCGTLVTGYNKIRDQSLQNEPGELSSGCIPWTKN